MPFTIRGRSGGSERAETRRGASSAAVLAMKWLADGVVDVRIEEAGRSYELATFQRRYLRIGIGPRARSLVGV